MLRNPRHFTLLLIVLVGFSVRSASAQSIVTVGESRPEGPGDLSISAFDPSDAVSPISVVEGPGIKIGEGTVVHPIVGMETGYISNVFYTNLNHEQAGLLRVFAQVGTASLNGARLNAAVSENSDADESTQNLGSFEYQTSVRLSYDQLLSGNEIVRSSGGGSGLGIGALFQGMTTPREKFSFGVQDNYTRLIRASNFETTTNDNRDLNDLRLTLVYHPQGRTLSGFLYYKNKFDIFEDAGNQYPDRMENRLGVHGAWRWLPQTNLYLDVSGGVVSGVGSGVAAQNKSTSFPLIAVAGITSLLNLRTTLTLSAGYTNGFYSSGPSFSAPLLDAMLTYRYSPLGRVGVSYDLIYTDSINANYYRDHVIRAFVQHAISPIVAMVQPELHFREYDGVTMTNGPVNRSDLIFAVRAGISYQFRNWIAMVLDYKFSAVSTDFRYNDAQGNLVDPGYTRNEVLLGVRAAL